MPDRVHATQTQPLPGAPREPRNLLKRLALVAAAGWVSGGALAAAQYTAEACQAPRLVRGAAWSASCLCLFVGAACLAAMSAMAAAAVAVHCARAADARRRILYSGVDSELAAERRHLVSLAAQAAALNDQAGAPQQARVLHLAGTEGHPVRRSRHGA